MFDPQRKLWSSLDKFFLFYSCNLLTNKVNVFAACHNEDQSEWNMCKTKIAELRADSTKVLAVEDIYKAIRTAENEIIARKQRVASEQQMAKNSSAHLGVAQLATQTSNLFWTMMERRIC